MLAEPTIPLAEKIPPEPVGEPNTIVRITEAWMPDKIAVIKLGGFLEDAGGRLLDTKPGVLRARFATVVKPVGFLERMFRGPPKVKKEDGIDLDINLNKPNPNESRLVVTAVFRVTGGGAPIKPFDWRERCERLFDAMKQYLMA
jgi:serine/threonine-protein kinase